MRVRRAGLSPLWWSGRGERANRCPTGEIPSLIHPGEPGPDHHGSAGSGLHAYGVGAGGPQDVLRRGPHDRLDRCLRPVGVWIGDGWTPLGRRPRRGNRRAGSPRPRPAKSPRAVADRSASGSTGTHPRPDRGEQTVGIHRRPVWSCGGPRPPARPRSDRSAVERREYPGKRTPCLPVRRLLPARRSFHAEPVRAGDHVLHTGAALWGEPPDLPADDDFALLPLDEGDGAGLRLRRELVR